MLRVAMKYIVALIKPFKLDDVRYELSKIGITGMTISEVRGFGQQLGETEVYKGAEIIIDFVPKIKVEMAITDKMLEPVIKVLRDTANSSKIGDGKIFVLDLEQVIRIRTGEQGEDAL